MPRRKEEGSGPAQVETACELYCFAIVVPSAELRGAFQGVWFPDVHGGNFGRPLDLLAEAVRQPRVAPQPQRQIRDERLGLLNVRALAIAEPLRDGALSPAYGVLRNPDRLRKRAGTHGQMNAAARLPRDRHYVLETENRVQVLGRR